MCQVGEVHSPVGEEAALSCCHLLNLYYLQVSVSDQRCVSYHLDRVRILNVIYSKFSGPCLILYQIILHTYHVTNVYPLLIIIIIIRNVTYYVVIFYVQKQLLDIGSHNYLTQFENLYPCPCNTLQNTIYTAHTCYTS